MWKWKYIVYRAYTHTLINENIIIYSHSSRLHLLALNLPNNRLIIKLRSNSHQRDDILLSWSKCRLRSIFVHLVPHLLGTPHYDMCTIICIPQSVHHNLCTTIYILFFAPQFELTAVIGCCLKLLMAWRIAAELFYYMFLQQDTRK